MPIDLEMLMSDSGQNFFPFSAFGDSSYSDSAYERALSFPPRTCVPRPVAKHQQFFTKRLSHGTFTNNVFNYKTKVDAVSRDELPYGTRKKKVSFADDRGLNLVEIREIPDSRHSPKWADDVITLLIGSTKRSVVKEKKWITAFEHSPWSDEKLAEKIENNMVALEYVSVKEGSDDILHGTVKVNNLSYEKKIFLRVTYDRWLSYIDIPCTFVLPDEKSEKPNAYDTFSFETKILPVAARYGVIEFSICFECDGKIYWDNNGGINYRLIAEYTKTNVSDNHLTSAPKLRHKLTHQHSSFDEESHKNAGGTDFLRKIILDEFH